MGFFLLSTVICGNAEVPIKPTVTLQPSWTQIYSGETVSVRCEIRGGEGAQWTYEWRPAKLNTPPTSNEHRITVTESDSGGYSCRGRRNYLLTEWSDIITLTVSYKPRPVLTVSPSWLSPGASVTLNCEVEHPSAGWSFYWYKAVPDLSEKSSSYELLPDGSGTAQDSYIIHGQTHTAGYVCRAGRGDPEYHTDHSQPKFVWSADVHSAASLTVSPDRVQHFTSDSVSLTCEGNFTEWRVRKFSEDGRLYSVCLTMTGYTCNIITSKSDTGVYWCESGSGEFSSAVNITVQNYHYYDDVPILVSPVHPVTEGASVSLSCSLKTQKILSNVFFYHNDKLIQNDPRGELKISAVSKSDEGFYKCQYSGGESAQSWMSVKAPPKPTVTLQPSWTQISRGTTVTVRCEIQGGEGAQWTYEWRRGQVNIRETSSVYTISRLTESDGGGYSCRGRRSSSWTEWSDITTLRVTVHITPTVTLQPAWTQIYSGDTVTVRCEIQGGEGAQWTYEWRRGQSNIPETSNEYRIIKATESDSGGYSCRGIRDYLLTEWSDIITLTVSYKPRPVLTVSPSWLSPGASVTLNCQVEHPSAGWSFYWYKAVPDLSEKSSSYELLPDGSGTAQDSYIIHGQTHTAGYVCRAGRGDPEYHTDHSQPKFVWSADVHSAASLTVSPDRVQHFTSDSVSLTCEGNFTEWRVRKFPEDGRLSDCRRMTGSTCNIITSKSDTGVYWCESGSGEFSSAVNITVQNYYYDDVPILVSPVHPVTEGASVSLSCSLRTQKILSNVFFYHNDKLIQNDPRGELKISAVSKSDEGFYKCQYSGRESAQSWMSVKVTGPSSSPVWLMVGLVCGVSLIIILLLLLYRCRQSKYSCFTRSIQSESHSPGSSTNHGVNQNETHVYDSPHYGTNNLYESVMPVEDNRNGSDEHQDVTYALIELKNFQKKRKHHKPEQSAVYSEVKMGAAEDSLMYAEVKRPKKEKAKKKAGQ
ncbi:unnamed protein product [Oreochromis niloticus]|nr:unnamed protein product [Mustela putorius furo]